MSGGLVGSGLVGGNSLVNGSSFVGCVLDGKLGIYYVAKGQQYVKR